MPSPSVSARSIGGYRLAGEVRRGGTAEVCRVEVEAAGEGARPELALKVALDPGENAGRLRAEYATLAAIAARDPRAEEWCVRVMESGTTDDGRPWFTMPWFPHSLRSWIETQAPPLAQVVGVLRRAIVAVMRLHDSGDTPGQPRLHGDLKPDNFLVDPATRAVVLADFGLARHGSLADASQHTLVYTPRYAPVEATLLLRRNRDPSEDAHALAVTLYWSLTGREPDARAAPVPYTAAGARWVTLQAARRPTDAEREEMARDSWRPLSHFVRLDEMEALSQGDEARLFAAVEDEVRRAGLPSAEVSSLSARISEPLLRALRRALEPGPDRRDGDLRKLVAACEHAEALLVVSPPTLVPRPSAELPAAFAVAAPRDEPPLAAPAASPVAVPLRPDPSALGDDVPDPVEEPPDTTAIWFLGAAVVAAVGIGAFALFWPE